MKIDFLALRMQESHASFCGTKMLPLLGSPYGRRETSAIGKADRVEVAMYGVNSSPSGISCPVGGKGLGHAKLSCLLHACRRDSVSLREYADCMRVISDARFGS